MVLRLFVVFNFFVQDRGTPLCAGASGHCEKMDSSIAQNKPVVVTLWQPHWAFSKYPLKVLEDTQTAFGPPDQMQIIATKGFGAANPEVNGWLKNFKITPEQLSDLMLKIQNAGKGQEEAAAKQWAADNKAVVDAWFSGTSG